MTWSTLTESIHRKHHHHRPPPPPPPQQQQQVSEITLNHLLRQALLSSAARCDDEDTLDRLRAKKEPGAGAREVGGGALVGGLRGWGWFGGCGGGGVPRGGRALLSAT